MWWWAVLRLALWPQTSGAVEGAVAAGGWGLSLLPVHCVPWEGHGRRPRGRASGRTNGRASRRTGWFSGAGFRRRG
ncbi:hypothetical protein [Streptomyces sp. MST-110588]|uniref:hypothetical protein n=1 Tax=Streptomyces sp. MST-110588 TaxID=2833628 RepID=UPI001F5D660A|nr:hypothetical protein [Streptomyces sp. MST-110588]